MYDTLENDQVSYFEKYSSHWLEIPKHGGSKIIIQ